MALPIANQSKVDTTIRLQYKGAAGGTVWSSGSKTLSTQIKNFKDSLPEALIYEYNPVKNGSAYKAIVGYKPPRDVTFSCHFDFMQLAALSNDINAFWTIIKTDMVTDDATQIAFYNTKTYQGKLTAPDYTETTNGVNVEQNYIFLPRVISHKQGTSINGGTEIYRYDNGKVFVNGVLINLS